MRELTVGPDLPYIEAETLARLWRADVRTYFRSNRHRALRRALMEEFGSLCWWCDRTVKEYPPRVRGEGRRQDEATVDHLISRLFRRKGDRVVKVLACEPCNLKRAKMEHKLYLSK